MFSAARNYRSSAYVGLIVTAVISAATFYSELREIHQVAAAQLATQVDNAERRLSMAAAELQAAAAFVEQANPPTSQFEDFVYHLPLSSQREVSWAWAKVVDASAVAELERQVRSETGNDKYAVKAGANRGLLAPVVSSFGESVPTPAGYDLSELPEVSSVLAKSGQPDSAMSAVFAIPQGRLSARHMFLAEFAMAGAGSGQHPARASILIRGINATVLSEASALRAGQEVRVVDLSTPQTRTLLGPAGDLSAANWSPVAPIDLAPLKLGISVSTAGDRPWPTFWLVPLVLGLLANVTYVAWRAGLLIRLQANAAIEKLAGTEKKLFAVREREMNFFENSGTANCEIDFPTARITRVNDAFCRMFQYDEAELLGRAIIDLSHPDDVAINVSGQSGHDSAPKAEIQFEKRYLRKDGSVLWAVANASLNIDSATGAQSYLIVILDITARKMDEETKAMLLKELAHRVRNTVQLTTSLARQTARTARSVKDYDSKFHRRLAALSAAHDLLFEQEWRSASLALIVRESLRYLLPEDMSHCAVAIDVPDLALPSQQAQTLAIAIQELAANSAQYGALLHGGAINLAAKVETEAETGRRMLTLSWRETSRKRVRKPHKSGFGTTMLETLLPQQFGGAAAVSWRSDGLRYAANLPLA